MNKVENKTFSLADKYSTFRSHFETLLPIFCTCGLTNRSFSRRWPAGKPLAAPGPLPGAFSPVGAEKRFRCGNGKLSARGRKAVGARPQRANQALESANRAFVSTFQDLEFAFQGLGCTSRASRGTFPDRQPAFSRHAGASFPRHPLASAYGPQPALPHGRGDRHPAPDGAP